MFKEYLLESNQFLLKLSFPIKRAARTFINLRTGKRISMVKFGRKSCKRFRTLVYVCENVKGHRLLHINAYAKLSKVARVHTRIYACYAVPMSLRRLVEKFKEN